MNKRLTITVVVGFLVILICLIGLLFISNPWNVKRIGDVPCPTGYSRIPDEDSYTVFLRNLPMKRRGSFVHLYNGGVARLQFLSAGVIDVPVLSNSEQCADMAMRIRAEYLFKEGRYADICFTDVNGKLQAYEGGASREAFEKYLRHVYGVCNTSSVFKETKAREPKDVQPGDILVYPSRQKGRYGHAILIADVARNKSGKLAILCVEGNTPAREAHIVRNPNPFRNPWFVLDDDDDEIHISVFHFKKKGELRRY